MMHLPDLIAQYKQTSAEISAAIASDDGQKVCALDVQYSDRFSKILQAVPSQEEEIELLIDFLLNELVAANQRSCIESTVCEKLKRIIVSSHNH